MADGFLKGVRSSMSNQDATGLATYFMPLSGDPAQDALRRQLAASRGDLKTFQNAAKRALPDELFALLVAHYLVYLRDAQYDSEDAQDIIAAFKLLDAVFSQVRTVVQESTNTLYFPTVRRIASAFSELSFRADAANVVANAVDEDARNTYTSTAVQKLSAAFTGALIGDPGPKRGLVLFFANVTLRIYLRLNSARLGKTIINKTSPVRDRLGDYSKADQVEHMYFCGRLSLVARQIRQAEALLNVAWMRCDLQEGHNSRLILIYLITTRLILGTFPTPDLLQAHNLDGPFGDLVVHLKAGNFKGVKAHLSLWQAWFMQRGIYLILLEKLEVICWRNLTRRVLHIVARPYENYAVDGTGSSPTLSLAVLTKAAQFAFGDPTLDVNDVECMVVSLIEQNYIKGYIWHAKGTAVFHKHSPFGFPPVHTVHQVPY